MVNSVFYIIAFGLWLFLGPGCSRKEEFKVISESPVKSAAVVPPALPAPASLETPEAAQGSVTEAKEEQFNPFLTPQEEDTFGEVSSLVRLDYLGLSAIIYSPSGSSVIINNRILRKGDSIDNKEITDILPESVILKDEQGEYIVSLKKIAAQ